MTHPLINEAVLLVLNHGGRVDLHLNKKQGYIEYNLNTGISRVVYAEEYRSLVGVENLKMAGVIVERVTLNSNDGVGYVS